MKKYEEENYKYENICDKIYPWVKTELTDSHALNGKNFSKKDAPVISFLGDLNVVFAIKRAEDVYEILKDNMLPPECDIIELYHKSCENLNRDVEFVVANTWDGGFGIVADGHHEASSVCFKHIWQVCADKLEDDLIIMIPRKDAVLFAPAGNKETVQKMIDHGEQAYEQGENKIRMIGMDLDGTLLKTNKELTAYTKDVLKRAAEQGIIVMPATGRPFSGIPKELIRLQEIRYAVTANGARVIDMKKNEVIVEELLAYDIAEAMLTVFERYDTFREIYYHGIGYASKEALARIDKYLNIPAMADYITSTRVPVDDVRAKFEEMNQPVDKIQALFTSVEDRDAARKDIEEVPGIEITGALPMNLEINAAGVNKGKAMIELGKVLGISREEIMAFGDGNNDLKMLKEVGTGVAMENAIPSLKEAADYVTLSNDEEGVAKFIEKYVLD